MLIAAVRRVRQPGCKFDEMPTFESQQGKDKSSALAVLAVEEDWFSDDLPLTADSKKLIEQTRGRWIVEVADLSGMRKADIEHLKSLLSRRRDSSRMAYGRLPVEKPREFIIVGTTNEDEYLKDLTGNRRYWPVMTPKWDLAALKRDRNQLWAEVAESEATGESIRLDPSLWDAAAAEQQKRTISEPWIDQIGGILGDRKGKISSTDAWEILGLPAGQRTQQHNGRFGVAMRALGWKRTRVSIDGKVVTGYVRGKRGRLRAVRVYRSSPSSVQVWTEGVETPPPGLGK
jgi:predicted P-loop ATPase